MIHLRALSRTLLLCALTASPTAGRRIVRVGMFYGTYPPWWEVNVNKPVDWANGKGGATSSADYEGGLFIDIFKEVANLGNFDVQFVPIADPAYFTDFVGVVTKNLHTGKIDVGWIPANHGLPAGYLHTLPFFSFPWVVMTKLEPKNVGIWEMFQPFTPGMWWMMLASVLYGALVLWLIRRIYTNESVADSFQRFPGYIYHAAAALLGGDEYDIYHSPAAGRIYRVGMLFLCMVFSATYTANLAAFLTAPSYQIHGPKTMAGLKKATVCARWTEPHQVASLRRFCGKVVVPPTDGSVALGRPGHWWARKQLQDGVCEAIVDIKVDAKTESLEHCSTMHLHNELQFEAIHDVGIIRANDTALWQNMSRAIANLVSGPGTPAYSDMLSRHLQYGMACTDEMRSGQAREGSSNGSEIEKITVGQMGGAFILFGVTGVLAVAFALTQRAFDSHEEPREEVYNEGLDAKLDQLLEAINAMRQQKAPFDSHEEPREEVYNEGLDAKAKGASK